MKIQLKERGEELAALEQSLKHCVDEGQRKEKESATQVCWSSHDNQVGKGSLLTGEKLRKWQWRRL